MARFFIPLLVLLLAIVLYRGGILSSQSAVSIGGCWGGFSWWRGRYTYLSGTLSRRLSVGRRQCLSLQAVTETGDLDITVEADDEILGFWQGVQNLSAQIDVATLPYCTIRLHARKFRGEFFFSLQ